MEISFEVDNIYIEPHGRNGVYVTVEADGASIASELKDVDRLEGMDVDVVRAWLISNDSHDDILEAIGEDKIRDFISHCE